MTEYPPTYYPDCGSELDTGGAPRYRCPDCERSVYHSPSVAASVAVVDCESDRVLLGERGTPPSEGRLTMPGGHIDLWEAPEAAAVRELAEETELTVDAANLTLLGVRDLEAEVDETGITTVKQVVCVDYAVPFEQAHGDPAAADDLNALEWVTAADFDTVPWAYAEDPAVCRTAFERLSEVSER